MTISLTDLRNWCGLTTAVISDTELTAALNAAARHCKGYLTARGVSTGGDAYDAAVENMAKANMWRILDAKGIKPSSMSSASMSMSSDVSQAVDQFMAIAEMELQNALLSNASNKPDLFIKRLRGGRGI